MFSSSRLQTSCSGSAAASTVRAVGAWAHSGGHAGALDAEPRSARLEQLLEEVGVQPRLTLARLTELTRSVWGEALLDTGPAAAPAGAAKRGNEDVD